MSAKKPGNSSQTSAKKRTVIRGQSKVKKLPVDAVIGDGDEIVSNVKPERVKEGLQLNVDFYRRATILLIIMGLIFGIGVQVGSKTGTTQVDEAISTILDSGTKQIDREVLERAAIEGALKASGDEWANYFPKSALEVLEEQSSNMFTGIGVWLSKSRGGQVKISSIQEDSPASRSGLSVGDQVLEVNGTDVRGASLTSVIALIRGEVGKRIELLVDREDKRILATLSTEKVAVRTVEAS